MKNLEKEILQAYMNTIKSVGGRGPKNIFVKIIGNRVEIHFLLMKSPLELFIQKHFENPEEYLETMYLEVHNCIKDAAVNNISEKTGKIFIYRDFQIEVNEDKFCLVLEMQ